MRRKLVTDAGNTDENIYGGTSTNIWVALMNTYIQSGWCTDVSQSIAN